MDIKLCQHAVWSWSRYLLCVLTTAITGNSADESLSREQHLCFFHAESGRLGRLISALLIHPSETWCLTGLQLPIKLLYVWPLEVAFYGIPTSSCHQCWHNHHSGSHWPRSLIFQCFSFAEKWFIQYENGGYLDAKQSVTPEVCLRVLTLYFAFYNHDLFGVLKTEWLKNKYK